jgi:ketosteroid isomerase-like protein
MLSLPDASWKVESMKILVAVTAAILMCGSVAQAADAGVEATIRQFGAAFNKGDVAAAKALHVTTPSIIDEVAPHFWSGPKAFDSWTADLGKSEAAEGKTDGQVAISAPTREVVSGDSAYVIVPSTYTYKQKGARLREVAQMTFVLNKTASGWKIAAWAWTGKKGVPVN